MENSSKKQKGSVLVFSLLVLSLLLVSAIAVMGVAVVEKRSSFATQRSVIAFQAADSGAERVLRRIYIDNSPPVATIAINGDVGDDNLSALASGLNQVSGANCSGSSLTATNSNNPAYSFTITFLDKDGTPILCSSAGWRDKVVKLNSQGFYRNTSRFIEMGIHPRE